MTATERIDFRQPRGTADVLNATFVFLRDEFKGLATALVVIVGPVALLASVFTSSTWEWYMTIFTAPEQWFEEVESGAPFEWLYVLGFPLYVVVLLLSVGLVYAYVMLYVEEGRGGFRPAEVWQRLKQSMTQYIATSLWGMVLFVGMGILFIVPCFGFVGAVFAFLFAVPVVMMVFVARFEERQPFWTAFGRIKDMLKGRWWSTVALYAVTTLIVTFLSSTITISVFAIYAIVYSFIGQGIVATIFGVLLGLASAASYFTYAILIVAFVIRYYGLVEEHEGVSLERRIEAIAPKGGDRLDPLAF